MKFVAHENRLIAALGEFGFSQYEARSYCALAAGGPMNGHEVARASGVPPSKIYEALGKMVDKGAVLIAHTDPVRYVARPWSDVLASARAKFDKAADVVEVALSEFSLRDNGGTIWKLPDHTAVLDVSTRVVASAERTIFASLWDAELTQLQAVLEAAASRGCQAHVAIYGATVLRGAIGYDLTNCGRSAMERMAGRRLMTLVADGRDAIIAEVHPNNSVEAVCTDNPVIALLIEEYVKADVLGRLLIDDMGEPRFDTLRRTTETINRLLKA
ncbi:MAG: helix-turn-helix domain-containing protein [Microlunatus sp.]